ncbi:hypothetical protein NA57DRAFT_59024 [Rhizodiscina lignyota]|uniref:Uncharacterized protein n=1 Tax=Rhizodiscina lignyota TaxID=1504668 RepID=A0A9P4I6B0_9PEZI|nr:hypothetical protein NA57DRAFT_59024 [Rhizodiscina lignyota]
MAIKSFLDLPKELRDKIYGYALVRHSICLRGYGNPDDVGPDDEEEAWEQVQLCALHTRRLGVPRHVGACAWVLSKKFLINTHASKLAMLKSVEVDFTKGETYEPRELIRLARMLGRMLSLSHLGLMLSVDWMPTIQDWQPEDAMYKVGQELLKVRNLQSLRVRVHLHSRHYRHYRCSSGNDDGPCDDEFCSGKHDAAAFICLLRSTMLRRGNKLGTKNVKVLDYSTNNGKGGCQPQMLVTAHDDEFGNSLVSSDLENRHLDLVGEAYFARFTHKPVNLRDAMVQGVQESDFVPRHKMLPYSEAFSEKTTYETRTLYWCW